MVTKLNTWIGLVYVKPRFCVMDILEFNKPSQELSCQLSINTFAKFVDHWLLTFQQACKRVNNWQHNM